MPTLLCCPSDDTRQCGHRCCLSGTLLWLDPRAGARPTSALHCSLQGWRAARFTLFRWSCLVPGAWDFGIALLGVLTPGEERAGESLCISPVVQNSIRDCIYRKVSDCWGGGALRTDFI